MNGYRKGIYKGDQVHNPENWKNQVVGQCMSWIKAGLQPRAITRDLDWGVKVPVKMEKEKYFMFGLMLPLDTFQLPKNGQTKMERIGKITGKVKTPIWFTF